MSKAKKAFYTWQDKIVLHDCDKDICDCLKHEMVAYGIAYEYIQELEKEIDILNAVLSLQKE